MRTVIIDCGHSHLSGEVVRLINAERNRPEFLAVMNLNPWKFRKAEFKHELNKLAVDRILLVPSRTTVDSHFKYSDQQIVMEEVVRFARVHSARVMFISSFEVLGDTQSRTEDAREMPVTEHGIELHKMEMALQTAVPDHYIIRLPYYKEDGYLVDLVKRQDFQPSENRLFNAVRLSEVAAHVFDILHTSGMYGKTHITPNDSLNLFNIHHDYSPTTYGRVPDYTLMSKQAWKLTPSMKIVREISGA